MFGFPLLYIYLFVVWGVLIGLLAAVAVRAEAKTEAEPTAGDEGA